MEFSKAIIGMKGNMGIVDSQSRTTSHTLFYEELNIPHKYFLRDGENDESMEKLSVMGSHRSVNLIISTRLWSD